MDYTATELPTADQPCCQQNVSSALELCLDCQETRYFHVGKPYDLNI